MMPHARKLVALVLPAAAGVDAAGWYAARAYLFVWLMETGLGHEDIGAMLTASMFASMVGIPAGALLAILVGPAAVASFGYGLCAAGLVAVGATPSALASAPLLVASFAHGLTRATHLAAVHRPFGRGWHPARMAMGALVAVGINVGAFVGPGVAGLVYEALGARSLFVGAGGVVLVAAVLVGAVAAADLLTERGPDEPGHSDHLDGKAFAMALGLALALGVGWVGFVVGTSAHADLVFSATMAPPPPWLHSLSPITVASTGLALGVVFGAVQLARLPLPGLLPIGAGFLLIGAALAAGLAPIASSTVAVGGLYVVIAIGEALVTGPLFARLAGGVHWRLSALPVAFALGPSYAVSAMATQALSFLTDRGIAGGSSAVLAGSAALCGGVGALALLAFWFLEPVLEPRDDASVEGDAG